MDETCDARPTGAVEHQLRAADVIEEMSATVVDTSGRVEHVYADTPLAQLAAAAFLRFPFPDPSGA